MAINKRPNESITRYLAENDVPRFTGQTFSSVSRINFNNVSFSKTAVPATAPAYPYQVSRAASVISSSPSSYSRRASVFSAAQSSPSVGTASTTPTQSSNPEYTFAGQFESMSIRHILPCVLREITGCTVEFESDEFDAWYQHSVAHFGEPGPPENSMCIFCTDKFARHGRNNWYDRMNHIAEEHLEEGRDRLEWSRPDFNEINQLYKNQLMTRQDYEHALAGSERPKAKDMVFKPLDWIPEEMQAKKDAEERKKDCQNAIVKESRQEAREREGRRSKSKSASKPKSKPGSTSSKSKQKHKITLT